MAAVGLCALLSLLLFGRVTFARFYWTVSYSRAALGFCVKSGTMGLYNLSIYYDLNYQKDDGLVLQPTSAASGGLVDTPDDPYPPFVSEDCRSQITTVTLRKIRSIGRHSFDNLPNLYNVKMEGCEIREIGAFAFANTAIQEIHFDDIVTIGDSAFEGCLQLGSFTNSKQTLKTIGNRSFYNTAVIEFSMPGLEVIGNEAFALTKLGTLSVPHVFTIGDRAFAGTELVSIEFQAPVNIGAEAFKDCENLKSITLVSPVEERHGITIGGSAFVNTSLDNFQLSGVVAIGARAFHGLEKLTNPQFGNELTEIGEFAFEDSGLESIDLSTVANIGMGAFYECSSLTSVTFSSSLQSIGAQAFKESGLTLVRLDSVTGLSKIEDEVFMECASLTACYFSKSVTTLGAHVFQGCSLLTTLVGSGVVSVGQSCFELCSKLDTVPFVTLESIGDRAFSETSLVEVNLSEAKSLSLGVGVFEGCVKLETCIVPESLTSLSASLFKGCSKLIEFTIPVSVASIGDACFANCSSLINMTYLGNVVFTGDFFGGCNEALSITVAHDYPSDSFGDCTNLVRLPAPEVPPTSEPNSTVVFNETSRVEPELNITDSCELVLECTGDCDGMRIEVDALEISNGAEVMSNSLSIGRKLVMSGGSSVSVGSKASQIQFITDNSCEIEFTTDNKSVPSISLGKVINGNNPKSIVMVITEGFAPEGSEGIVVVDGYGFACETWKNRTTLVEAVPGTWEVKCVQTGAVTFAATVYYYEQMVLHLLIGDRSKEDFSGAQIAGISIAVIVGITIIAVVFLVMFNKRTADTESSTFFSSEEDYL